MRRAPGDAWPRWLFGLAALVHVAFAVWTVATPMACFDRLDLARPTYPAIWSGFGLLVGLFGVLYATVAWRPASGDRIAAVGLLGMVLGPAGWVAAVWTGDLPPRTMPVVLLLDLVWWCPFLAYLLRAHRARRTLLALFCLAANGLSCLGLLAVAGGTEAEPDVAARAAFIAGHVPLWSTVWLVWTMASMSLLLFFCQWAARLVELGVRPLVAWAGPAVVAVGVGFDLSGEIVEVAFMTAEGLTLDEYRRLAWLYNLLGPAAANGLYCAAGLFLSAVSWRVGFLRGRVGWLGFVMWSVGLGLTGAALAHLERVMVGAGGGVMGLFLLWLLAVAWRLRPAPAGSGTVSSG